MIYVYKLLVKIEIKSFSELQHNLALTLKNA